MEREVPRGLSRRELLVGASVATGYALAADTVLAQAIKTDTDGLAVADAKVPVGAHQMPVYEARPATGTGHPVLLLVSEIWGVHEYIRDCARRFAKEGYHAVAPELFAREGGVAHLTNIQDILKIVFNQPREQTLGDLTVAVDWAKTRPGARGDRAGVTGWCWGGSTTIQVAATNVAMKAAVAWYAPVARPYPGKSGPLTGFDVVSDIKIPFLGLFGETDNNPTPEDARKFIQLLKQHNPDVDIVVYQGAGHAFHADYRPSYNKAAADDAWKRCVGWFDRYLKT